ncbi:MAG: hypothetical protein ABEJ83_00415 [Candidatus Nanohaloarchaea archaeon]
MPIYRLRGGKEVSSSNAETYKSAVKDFLKAEGKVLERDSSTHGTTADLVAKDPVDDRLIWVESKDTDLSRWNDDFLTEIGRFFIEYIDTLNNDRFDLYVFVRRLKASRKWDKIFTAQKRASEDVREFYDRILNESNLQDEEIQKIEGSAFDEFEEFLGDIHVYEVDYEKLQMRIEELENEEDHNIHDIYLREKGPIREKDEITLNLLKVEEFPDRMYQFRYVSSSGMHDILDAAPDDYALWVNGPKVFTLEPYDDLPEELQNKIKEGTQSSRSFEKELEIDDWIPKILIKKSLGQKLSRMGFLLEKYRNQHYYYLKHRNLENEERKLEGLQYNRVFDDTDDTFVKHDALRINLLHIEDEYYLELDPCIIFTEDGENMITGDDADRLHDSFSARFENNSTILRDLKKWFDLLGVDGHATSVDISTDSFEKSEAQVRPPEDGSERDDIMKMEGLESFGI